MTLLFDNQLTDATSLNWPGVEKDPYQPDLRTGGGPIQVAFSGIFDGAEIKVELSQNSLPFVTLLDTDFSFPDVNRMDISKACIIRFTIIGAGPSTSISVDVVDLG